MRPTLWKAPFAIPTLGPLDLPAYFTLISLGFVCAWLLASRDGRRQGIDPADTYDFTLWMIVWGVIGARVMHLIFDGHFMDYVHLCTDPTLVPAIDPPVDRCTADAQCWTRLPHGGVDRFFLCDLVRNRCYPPRDCLMVFKAWRGGLAFYGGLIFATAFAWRWLRRHRIPFLKMADISAYGIALGLFFGRIGCFLNGCCYGKACAVPPGVVFPRGSPVWHAQLDAHLIGRHDAALPVHPTQLYQAAANLAVFALLYWVVRPRKRAHGEVLAWFLILKALGRGIVEIWRDDERGVFFGGRISTAQLVGLGMVLGGVALLRWLSRQREEAPV
jgi:phosphatidylglycerol---prolipoprotein diacylglyceryl transferase